MTVLIAIAFVSLLAATAIAAWSSQGSGRASGLALTMPAGNTPTASVSGSDVTVAWSAAKFSSGASIAGYVVRRYDAASGAAATVGANCSGVVTSTICTENSVPPGAWIYTDTPVQQSWTGARSPASSAVTVGTAPLPSARANVSTSPAAAPKAQLKAGAANQSSIPSGGSSSVTQTVTEHRTGQGTVSGTA